MTVGLPDPLDTFTDPGKPRAIVLADSTRVAQGKFTPADWQLGQLICVLLNKHYPGWPWTVDPNHGQGIVSLRCGVLTGYAGYVVKLAELSTPEDWRKAIVNAAGEILERFGCARGPMTFDQLAGAKKDVAVLAELKAERATRVH